MPRRSPWLHKLEPTDVGPRAGKLGVSAIVVYGLVTVVVVFIAAYFWSDGDEALSGIIGIASIGIPVGIGFFFAEAKSQRAGAIAFVLTAAILSGAVGAYAYMERDDYEMRRDQLRPQNDAEAGWAVTRPATA
jgi:hypothetical protein